MSGTGRVVVLAGEFSCTPFYYTCGCLWGSYCFHEGGFSRWVVFSLCVYLDVLAAWMPWDYVIGVGTSRLELRGRLETELDLLPLTRSYGYHY